MSRSVLKALAGTWWGHLVNLISHPPLSFSDLLIKYTDRLTRKQRAPLSLSVLPSLSLKLSPPQPSRHREGDSQPPLGADLCCPAAPPSICLGPCACCSAGGAHEHRSLSITLSCESVARLSLEAGACSPQRHTSLSLQRCQRSG